MDIVVSPANVEFGEQGGFFHVINELRDKREWIGISDCVGVQVVIMHGCRVLSFFGTKKKGEAWGDFKGTIHPILRCSSMKALHVSISVRLRE